MTTYVNVLTGETVTLDYEPAGEAWSKRPNASLAKKLLRDEARAAKTPDPEHDQGETT